MQAINLFMVLINIVLQQIIMQALSIISIQIINLKLSSKTEMPIRRY